MGRNIDRRLRPDIAAIPRHLDDDPDVAYFATRNAGYTSGDVMLCLAPLTVSNWWSAACRIVRRRFRGLTPGSAGRSRPTPGQSPADEPSARD